MAEGIPFMEETGRKDAQNGGRSNSKNNHGFWTLFVNFERKNSLLLLLTSNLSFSYSFKLNNKIRLLAFRSPLRIGVQIFYSCAKSTGATREHLFNDRNRAELLNPLPGVLLNSKRTCISKCSCGSPNDYYCTLVWGINRAVLGPISGLSEKIAYQKAIVKSWTLWWQCCYSHAFLIWRGSPHTRCYRHIDFLVLRYR